MDVKRVVGSAGSMAENWAAYWAATTAGCWAAQKVGSRVAHWAGSMVVAMVDW
jgi:hypothetical protein